ncbi:uncharacterized protein K489DRAFT_179046 [Dissoconium aciculare CBS 342.82]|uniref:Uncharacterized protein n=1 Tax=Dissoconium aciculare CBS 342.82 TaxID=1314786 RepID=A0A6J3M8A0_9PEZI|nr:uncharacterized protein K489DRAFT_179046 [Dissoconium aciculare CBS 342.82]KAF1824286.1 hypothetical protein K489DRAFT_179046 [Dissoconium aciculare CBS 342.82]
MLLPVCSTCLLLISGFVSNSAALAIPDPSADMVKDINFLNRPFCDVPGAACVGKRESTTSNTEPGNANLATESKISTVSTDRRDDDYLAVSSDVWSNLLSFFNSRPAPDSESQPLRLKISFCGIPGMGCNYRKAKRSFEELPQTLAPADAVEPREPGPLRLKISFCGMPGMGCNYKKAKRDSEDPSGSSTSLDAAMPREPVTGRGRASPCGMPGMGCVYGAER